MTSAVSTYVLHSPGNTVRTGAIDSQDHFQLKRLIYFVISTNIEICAKILGNLWTLMNYKILIKLRKDRVKITIKRVSNSYFHCINTGIVHFRIIVRFKTYIFPIPARESPSLYINFIQPLSYFIFTWKTLFVIDEYEPNTYKYETTSL